MKISEKKKKYKDGLGDKSKRIWMNVNMLDKNNILHRNGLRPKERRISTIINNKGVHDKLDIHDTEWISKFKGNENSLLHKTMTKRMSLKQFEITQKNIYKYLESVNDSFNICSHSECPDQCTLLLHNNNILSNVDKPQIRPQMTSNKKNSILKFMKYMCISIKDNCCMVELED